jgi:hypothetical protein
VVRFQKKIRKWQTAPSKSCSRRGNKINGDEDGRGGAYVTADMRVCSASDGARKRGSSVPAVGAVNVRAVAAAAAAAEGGQPSMSRFARPTRAGGG